VAPGNGKPSESETVPETVFCAKPKTPESIKNKENSFTNFFI